MKFDAFPTSESRHAEASRGIVVIPAPLPPLEEFPLNRPYRITAASPYMALHRIEPMLVRRQTRDSQCPDHPATLYMYRRQPNPRVSAKLRPSETGQPPRHRVYAPRHIHRSSLRHIFVDDEDGRLLQATDQVNTTKLHQPTNRISASPPLSRTETEVSMRRFHGTSHE